jgi:hypothetical protein
MLEGSSTKLDAPRFPIRSPVAFLRFAYNRMAVRWFGARCGTMHSYKKF